MNTTFPSLAEQLALIRRGIEKIVPEDELAPRLEWSRKTGQPLRIKYGIDPTGIDVHLGHTVPLRKLRQFQELGHHAVIIIGNATALVGDPSGRDQARSKRLTADEVEANARDYLQQVGKVVDLSQAEVHRNGDWFGQMGFGEIIQLCSHWTIQQILHRQDFARRIESENPVYLHECLYPVMQAFDSVCIGADVELGGTEQLFTFVLARHLQASANACLLAERWMPAVVRSRRKPDGTLPPQIGVMSPILVGLDGLRRMGKSLGNYIGISEPPYEQMKKFMQLPDDVMRTYYELLTDIPLLDIDTILAGHPKQAKQTLATHVMQQFVSDNLDLKQSISAEVVSAKERWEQEIAKKALPQEISTVVIFPSDDKSPMQGVTVDWAKYDGDHPQERAYILLWKAGLTQTKSEARKLIQQGGAYLDEDKRRIAAFDEWVTITSGRLLWAGSKKCVRLQPCSTH